MSMKWWYVTWPKVGYCRNRQKSYDIIKSDFGGKLARARSTVVALCITGGMSVLPYGRCRLEGTSGLRGILVALGPNRRLLVVVAFVVVGTTTTIDLDWRPVRYRRGLEVDVTMVRVTLATTNCSLRRYT